MVNREGWPVAMYLLHRHREKVFEQERKRRSPPVPTMSVLRVAVAGTGGLARLIAYFIDRTTSHHVVFLSRQPKPRLSNEGYQVAVVDYNNPDSLRYALRGIDTVVSTVLGPNQIQLIRAAVEMRVRRFAAAEFEGLPDLRPYNDPLDRHRAIARRWLTVFAPQMQSTSFVCGVLYERFQPGGLSQSRIGTTTEFDQEGDYIMDIENLIARIPAFDAHGEPNVMVCMTAATDVARFVTRALDLATWPPVMTICGERMNVLDLVQILEDMRGQECATKEVHNVETLHSAIAASEVLGDSSSAARLHTLLATAQGQYDFPQPALLNTLFPSVTPATFRAWFQAKWAERSAFRCSNYISQ